VIALGDVFIETTPSNQKRTLVVDAVDVEPKYRYDPGRFVRLAERDKPDRSFMMPESEIEAADWLERQS
jgi:hypothetical protein